MKQELDQDDWDAHWENFGSSAEGNAASNYRYKLITNALGSMENSTNLVDVGSGQGEIALSLAQDFPNINVMGIEYSASGVKIAVAAAKSQGINAQFTQRDLLIKDVIPLDLVGLGDVGICTEVLEHIDNPKVLLLNAAEYLKVGAKIVVTVPAGPRTAFDRFIGHRRHYTKKSLSALLNESGYRVVSIHRAGFPFFNLYRLLVLLRGKKLIQDLTDPTFQKGGGVSVAAQTFLKVFKVLFRFNLDKSPFGWQLVAVATNEIGR